jgi:hypothetical protein
MLSWIFPPKNALPRRRARAAAQRSRPRARPALELLEARLVLACQANGLPILHGLPGAPVAVYLDFEGYGAFAPYDEDGDPTTFNAAEQAHITEAWRQMASYYSMFDVDVTTVLPKVPCAWDLISNSITGEGYSYVGSFPNSSPLSFNPSDNARTRVSEMAHEVGHNFGLQHQSVYDLLGNKTAEYSGGYDGVHSPIMGLDYYGSVHKWFIGHPSTSPGIVQDDVAVIASQVRRFEPAGGDGFLPHANGGTLATAVPLAVTGAVQSAQGVIARLTDKDAYSFDAGGGPVAIDAVPPAPSGLAIKLEVYRADGTLLASKDGKTDDQHLTLNLPGGTYYVVVSSHGGYGDLGQYSLSVHQLPLGWQTQDVGPASAAGSAAYDPGSATFTLAAAGAHIGSTSDSFRYVYQTLTGDGFLVARVLGQDDTQRPAKAGVMIRDSLSPDAKEALIAVTPGQGVTFQYRRDTGGDTTLSSARGPAAPSFVKLVRAEAPRRRPWPAWSTAPAPRSTSRSPPGPSARSSSTGATSAATPATGSSAPATG